MPGGAGGPQAPAGLQAAKPSCPDPKVAVGNPSQLVCGGCPPAACTAHRSLLLLPLRRAACRRRLHALLPGLLEAEACAGLLLQAALLVHFSGQRRGGVGEQLRTGVGEGVHASAMGVK